MNRKDDSGTNFNYVEFFKHKYRNIDVLIIDDIQYLGGATETQKEFFHTFNELYGMNKQIVLSADCHPKEIELLYHLAKNPNRVFTRDKLLDEIWGFKYYGDSRTVDVHVKRLREKLEGVSEKWSLKTVWGVGYKFETK